MICQLDLMGATKIPWQSHLFLKVLASLGTNQPTNQNSPPKIRSNLAKRQWHIRLRRPTGVLSTWRVWEVDRKGCTGIYIYPWRIHGTCIFTYFYHKNQPNVGKYIIYMDSIYIYISWIYHPNRMDQKQSPTSTRAFISRESQAKPLFATSQLGYLPIPISISHGLAFSANIPGKLSRIKITTSISDWTLPFGHHPSEIDTFQLISRWVHVPLLKVDRQTGFIILHLGF